ncbi:MAG: hypothetical protein FWD06_04885 [Oscillospiraceae bacterium]|nr:hypothetical protein [Oscillospiraceae bacterium]
MSELQTKTYELVMKFPDEMLRGIFEMLTQAYALIEEAHPTDDEYFCSIPGYVDSLNVASAQPWEDCLTESDVNW